MKIIKHGTPKQKREIRMIAECSDCKCVFTFDETESERIYNNGGGYVFYCACPECGNSCSWDTGYPGGSKLHKESDLRVKKEHARLMSIVSQDALKPGACDACDGRGVKTAVVMTNGSGDWETQLRKCPDCGRNAEASRRSVRVLRLTLKRKWFDMIASGIKKEEYRKIKPWILSRLEGKEYDRVEFSNGYGKQVPKVTLEYLGWGYGYGKKEWGGGSMPGSPLVVIRLGRIISVNR